MNKTEQITDLLTAWSGSDASVLDRLLPQVESELRQTARRLMRREPKNHTLQTTALVNEAFIKLTNQRSVSWLNRAHFFALAATVMRRVLLNHARDKQALKRGGRQKLFVNAAEAVIFTPEKSAEIIALDEALERLARFDALKSRLVELRFFGGLTVEETAQVLKISPAAVSAHWRLAKAWLTAQIKN